MDTFCKALGAAIVGACFIIGLSALSAVPVKILWNALMPDLFGLTAITFMQAWGLNILSACLFKSVK